MTPRGANASTAALLVLLIATVAFTAPRWARFLRQPISSLGDEVGSIVAAPAASGTEGAAEAERKINVKLYFEAPDGPGLLAEERAVGFSADLGRQLRLVVEALVRGSTTGLAAPLAPETKVLEVFVTAAGVAYLDLSKEALTSVRGGSKDELLSVYAIVNSITANFPAVKRVQILVDDHPVATLAGHVDLSRPLPADMTFLATPSPSPSPPPELLSPESPSPAASPPSS
jgi:spore germination protein GerM